MERGGITKPHPSKAFDPIFPPPVEPSLMGDNLRDKQFTNWFVISIVWPFLLRMIHSDTLSGANYLIVKHLAF